MKNQKRKIVLINKRFQLALIIKFLLVNILVMGLFGVFLFLFMNSEIEANLYSAHVTYQNMSDMLLPIIITLSVLNILISSGIITVFVLYASFRIAGPLYRFNAAIDEINQGNLKPMLSLREKDELYAFSETLKELTSTMVNHTDNCKNVLSELKASAEKMGEQDILKKIEDLESLLKSIKY
jgi:nitrogen fixation/metabolism regulation signal transduction histidine kinase